MSLFASKWLAHAVLTSVAKQLDTQLPRIRNVWRDQDHPDVTRAVDAAWNRLDEARLAVRDALDIIKEASK